MRSEKTTAPRVHVKDTPSIKKKTPTYQVGVKAGIYSIHDKDPWSKRRSKNHGKKIVTHL